MFMTLTAANISIDSFGFFYRHLFSFGMCGRRREKENFPISKPRNKLSKKEVQYGIRNNLCLQEETPLKQK